MLELNKKHERFIEKLRIVLNHLESEGYPATIRIIVQKEISACVDYTLYCKEL